MKDRYVSALSLKLRKSLLMAGAAVATVAISCGGSEENKQVENADTTVETEKTVQTTPTEAITPTVEADNDSLFLEKANELLNSIDQNTSLTDEQVQALKGGFSENWQEASDDPYLEYGAFYDIRNALAARNKTVPEEAVVLEMKRIQDFMASVPEWGTFYQASFSDGAFDE